MAKLSVLVATLLLGCSLACGASAEVTTVRVGRGYGIVYLPLFVMEARKLVESQAARRGIEVTAEWRLVDGGNNLNDAILADAIDVAGAGVPGFLTLWSRTEKTPHMQVRALAALSSIEMSLNTRNPRITSLRDFSDGDKIALPGVKTSLAAVVLQMMVAHELGAENFDKLDRLTVGLPYPEAYTALTSGRGEINSHLASPPYSEMELKVPGIRRVASSVDLLGQTTIDLVFAKARFCGDNPKLCSAFVAALEDADALIKSDPDEAARIYVAALGDKGTVEDIRAMIVDKNTVFTTRPDNTMAYAEFMARAGTIKLKPASWRDYFLPATAGDVGG